MGFWLTVLMIWVGLVVYLGFRGRQAFDSLIPSGFGIAYWILFILIASSFIWDRMLPSGNSSWFQPILNWVGAYSIAAFFYSLLFVILIDILRLLDRWLGFIPDSIKESPAKVGLAVVCLVAGLLLYGTWNAWHPVVRHYEITIPKSANGSQSLHAILLSDLHLGNIVNSQRLAGIIDQIQQRDPDIILLAGDVIDDDIGSFVEQNMAAIFRQVDPRLGIYMVLGNHDGRGTTETVTCLEEAGITVLRNQYVLINDSFYLVGREDRGHGRASAARKPLAEVMAGINHDRPIIMLDHNPSQLEEGQINGVDLQLSGHTHQGQLFPLGFITRRMYEVDWGYLRKGEMQVIVSTGVGTWGPPIRIGNTPEVVDLKINFSGESY